MLVCVAYAQTLDLPRTVRQGGVVRVHGPGTAVKARMNGRTIRLFRQTDGGSLGLMPVPVDQKPGDYKLELLDQGGATVAAASIQVTDAHYRKQNVTIGQSLAELKPSADEVEPLLRCNQCANQFQGHHLPDVCPKCGSVDVTAVNSTDMVLEDFEIEK